MSGLLEAARQALEALEATNREGIPFFPRSVLTNLRTAIEQCEKQEPMWFYKKWAEDDHIFYRTTEKKPDGCIPLYTAPAVAEKQEPVAWLNPYGGVLVKLSTGLERSTYTIPLYTHPAP